jgi:hypothetical protein
LGQFLSADPLEYIDSFNRFAYAGFDPVNGVDPLGLGLKGTDADKGWAPSEPTPEPDGDEEASAAHVRDKARYLISSRDNQNPDLPENPRLTPGERPGALDRFLQGAEDLLDDVADTVDDVVTTLVSAVVHEIGGPNIMHDGAKTVGDAAGAAAKFAIIAAAVVASDGAVGAAVEGTVARGAVGFAQGAAESAFQGMRGGGGHAMRKLIDEGLIPNSGSLASRTTLFQKLLAPVLQNPTHTFNWSVGGPGGVKSKGFIGKVGGRDVFVFVAKEGPYQGRVLTSGVVQESDWALWGLAP